MVDSAVSLLLGLIVAPSAPSFQQAVDRAARLIDSTPACSVRVAVRTEVDGTRTESMIHTQYKRPDRILITIQEPAQGDFDKTNRSYLFAGSKAIGVDHYANEFLSRTAPKFGSFAERTESVIGNLGEPFACAVGGASLKSVMWRFAKLGQWKTTSANGLTTYIAANSQRKASLAVSFQRDGRLSRVQLIQEKNLTLWSYTYKLGGSPTLAIPPSARKVTQFTARPALPKFLDTNARQLIEASAKRYDGLRQYVLDADGSTPFRLWVSGRNLRFEAKSSTWIYRSGNVIVWDAARKKVYTGRSSSGEMIEALSTVGHPVPPIARHALLQANPIRALLSKDFTVRSTGSMEIAGTKLQLTEVRGPYWRGNLDFVSGTKLLWQMNVSNIDFSGRIINRSNLKLTYRNVGMPIGSEVFEFKPPRGSTTDSVRKLIKT